MSIDFSGYIDSPPDPAPPDRAGIQQSSWKFGSYADGCSTGRGSSLGGGGSNGERGTLSRAGRRTPLSQTKTDASIASSGNNNTSAKKRKNKKKRDGEDDVHEDDDDLENSGEYLLRIYFRDSGGSFDVCKLSAKTWKTALAKNRTKWSF